MSVPVSAFQNWDTAAPLFFHSQCAKLVAPFGVFWISLCTKSGAYHTTSLVCVLVVSNAMSFNYEFISFTGFPTIYWLVPTIYWCVPTIFWSFPIIFLVATHDLLVGSQILLVGSQILLVVSQILLVGSQWGWLFTEFREI